MTPDILACVRGDARKRIEPSYVQGREPMYRPKPDPRQVQVDAAQVVPPAVPLD